MFVLMIRTNDSTIQCDISASELKDFDLTPGMVVDGDKRADEFIGKLNAEMAQQLSYDPAREVLMLSKNLMPDGSLRIMVVKLTDEEIEEAALRMRRAAEGILKTITSERLEDIRQKSGTQKAEALNDMLSRVSEMLSSIYVHAGRKQSTEPPELICADCRFSANFKTIDDLIRFCRIIRDFPVRDAKLYKSKDFYYLFFAVEATEESILYQIETIGMEYADEFTTDPLKSSYVQENGECLIDSDAIKALGQIE